MTTYPRSTNSSSIYNPALPSLVIIIIACGCAWSVYHLQERIIHFKKNDDTIIMNYRIAHDYVPSPHNRTLFYIILRIVLPSISILYFIISFIFGIKKYRGNRDRKHKRKCLLRMSISIIFIIMVLQSGYFFFGCLSTYNVQAIHLTVMKYSNTILSLLGLLFVI